MITAFLSVASGYLSVENKMQSEWDQNEDWIETDVDEKIDGWQEEE